MIEIHKMYLLSKVEPPKVPVPAPAAAAIGAIRQGHTIYFTTNKYFCF